ncbi:MAG TPA: membrane protein insertion efficiency factor YidD [Planctomycetota bacterium]|nr:membrane protein insertion efficiency factor YidD [Planctomycetota bacterium]
MRRGWKVILCSLLGLAVYLAAESFLPPSAQPTARIGLALIHGYQATGSKLMESGGVHCRYQPTCSHYAEDAIAYYGTVSGVARAAGRIWRCSPWGGTGYDPAVEDHSAAYLIPQQETPEERKAREEAQKKAAEEMKKAAQEWEKAVKGSGQEIGKGCAKGGVACVFFLIMSAIGLAIVIFIMVWTFKDATARGDSNAILWPILSFFFPLIGLIVYLAVRPKGDLSPCPTCHKQRLSTLPLCPHCKGGAGAPPKTA